MSATAALRGSGRTLHQVATATEDDRPAVSFLGSRSFTRAELAAAVRERRDQLRGAGVAPGDRVCLMLPNGPDFLVTLLATSALGGVTVPLNLALRGRALVSTVEQMAPCRVVTDSSHAEAMDACRAAGVDLTDVWYVDGRWPPGPAISGDDAVVEPWDPALILLTSGTTGLSKGVVWSHQMALTFAEHTTWVMGYDEADVIHTCLPMFHINALLCAVLAGLQTGAHVVVAERFSASRFWSELVACGATTTNMMGSIPAVLWRREPEAIEREHSLRLAMVLPLPADRGEFENRFGVPTTEVYGSTDTALPLGIPFGSRRPGSCGIPTPGWEARLVDEDDAPVPPGTPGELVTRPLTPFIGQSGYWRMPELTWQSMRNQWFHTGDLCVQDDEGWFTYLDRKRDVVRVSGENVAPVGVEQALLTHPDVAEAAVLGLPGELGEDSVAAVVVLRPGATAGPADLRAHVVADLPYFAVPRYIAIRDALPKTATEKVSKAELRADLDVAEFWDGGLPRRNSTQEAP